MSRATYDRLSHALSTLFLFTTCSLCAAGCHNTCFSLALNSPGSTVNVKISNPPPTCTLTTANGIIHVEIGAAAGATSPLGVTGEHIAQIFVTFTGVDAYPDALPAEGAPGWHPLAPDLQAHPVQMDLLADRAANASLPRLADAVLPAGVYRQIRLRLANSLPGGPVVEGNRCGAGSPHCAVMSDGRIQALTFSPSTPSYWVLPESNSGRFLYVPPDGVVALVIEFDRGHSWLWPTGDAFLFTPIFHLRVQHSSDAN